MLTKTLLSGLTTTLLAASLYGCGGSSSALETPNTGTEINDGLISQKNFLLEFSDVAPAFLDIANNSTTATTSDVTVSIADNNNRVITVPKTIFFETEWGSFIQPSCETDTSGTCTVTWQTGKITDASLSGFRNTIVAYSSKSGDTGQESFFDANDNGLFNDGETATDLDEPFINKDDSFDGNGNATFTAGDKVIDTINGVDITGADGLHNTFDGRYNGPNCAHSSLCSPTRAVSTVWASGSLLLTGTDTFTIGGTTQGLVDGGGAVILQNNGGDDLPVAANGQFTFATAFTPGQNYSVTILTQPVPEPGDPVVTCTVIDGTGQVAGTVTTVVINCEVAP